MVGGVALQTNATTLGTRIKLMGVEAGQYANCRLRLVIAKSFEHERRIVAFHNG